MIKIPTEQKMVTDKMGMQNTSQRKEWLTRDCQEKQLWDM